MRSSGSPGSWPPSAAEFRCVSLTLHSHPETSNLFPEFGGMFHGGKLTRSYLILGMQIRTMTCGNVVRGKAAFWLHDLDRSGERAVRRRSLVMKRLSWGLASPRGISSGYAGSSLRIRLTARRRTCYSG